MWKVWKSTTPAQVQEAYRLILGREPENDRVVREHLARGSQAAIMKALLASDEFNRRLSFQHPFFYAFNATAVIQSHEVPDRTKKPGHIVNFLNVATNLKYVGWAGEGVEGLPFPGNFHAGTAEWAAALRAVDLAKERFCVVELGAGWGCWAVNTAVAAKRRGLAAHAIAVEGDAEHCNYIREHSRANGLTESEIEVRQSVAGAKSGMALFPIFDDPSRAYGQEPQFFDTEPAAEAYAARAGCRYSRVPVETLADITRAQARVDLLHVDIQGGEATLLPQSLGLLNEKVAYVVVGTHGRQIEGHLIGAFRDAGWVLEIEQACTLPTPLEGTQPYVDGVQGWRNPRLV